MLWNVRGNVDAAVYRLFLRAMKPTNFKSHRPLRPWDVHGLLFWIASAVALIPSVGVLAQLSGRGEISRRVSNQALDLFLEGARVDLVGTNRAVLTDRDGHFRVAASRAGATILIVSYSGLNSQNVVLDEKPTQVVARDIGLVSDVHVLEAFKVARRRDGHAFQGRATGPRRSGRSIANVRSVRMRTPRRSSCLRPKPTRW